MSTSHYIEKIMHGAFLVFASMFFGKLFAYLFIIVIATSLGSHDYGVLSLGMAIFSFLNAFSLLGLDEGIIRFVSYFKGKNDLDSLKGTIYYSFKTILSTSIFFSILLIIFSDFISENIFNEYELTKVLFFMALALPFSVIGQIFLSSFRAFQKAQYEVLIKELLEKSSRLLITFLLILAGFKLMGALIGFVSGMLIMASASIYFFNKKIINIFNNHIQFKDNRKELLNFSLPLLFKNFMWFIVAWTDVLMIGYFRTPSDVGVYNIALPTANLIITPAFGIMYLFLPVITELYSKNQIKDIENIYKRISKYIMLIDIPIFMTLFVLSKETITLFFGHEYINAAIPLVILSIGYLLYSLSDISVNILSVLKKTKTIFAISSLFALSNIILNLILIPKFGIVGASIGTSISFIIGGLSIILVSYFYSRLHPFMFDYKKIFISLILTLIVSILIKNLLQLSPIANVLILIPLIWVLYGVLIIIFKVFTKEEIDKIKEYKNLFWKTTK